MEKLGYYVGVTLVAFLFVVLGPLITLWAINTLFPALAISYTFWSWLATFILMMAFGNKGVK